METDEEEIFESSPIENNESMADVQVHQDFYDEDLNLQQIVTAT